jgi:hypothetical protein
VIQVKLVVAACFITYERLLPGGTTELSDPHKCADSLVLNADADASVRSAVLASAVQSIDGVAIKAESVLSLLLLSFKDMMSVPSHDYTVSSGHTHGLLCKDLQSW